MTSDDHTSINCREFVDFILAYRDGELPDAQRTAFESHLSMCPPCVSYLRSYDVTVKATQVLCDDAGKAPAEDVPEQLIQAILKARRA